MTPQPMIPQRNPLPNPILDEIDRAHASLSPPAQQAIGLSGVAPPAPADIPRTLLGSAPRFAGLGQTADAPPPSQPSPNAMQARGLASPPAAAPLVGAPPSTGEGAIRPLATPSTVRGLGPLQERTARDSGELARITAPGLQGIGAHTKADTGRSGVSQIHNPWARIPLQIADAVGRGFFPGFEMAIPGTSGHHDVLVHQARQNVAADEQQQNAEAQQQHLGAETNEQNADAFVKTHPTVKQEEAGKTITTDQGVMQWNPETQRYDIKAGGAPEKEQQNVHVLPDGSVVAVHHDPATGKSSAEVVYKGDPAVKTEVKQLEIGGKPHQVLINSASGATIKDLGETGEKPPTVNVNAGLNRADHSYDKRNAELTAIGKPISDLSARFGRLQDTLGQGTPQADALVAPELMTVMAGGMGSGLRMNEAEIARVVGGRSKWESLRAAIQQWSTDPAKANSITPEQRQQIRALVGTVGGKLTQKQQILNDAYTALAGTDDEKEHRRIVNDVRSKFMQIDEGGAQQTGKNEPAGATVKYSDGGRNFNIPADQVQEFLKDHPKAQRK